MSACGLGPPKAPRGKKWRKVGLLSDEFGNNKLDSAKWLNTDPNRYLGKQPTLFVKDAVSEKNGRLRLTSRKFPKPRKVRNTTWTHAGANIYSKHAARVGDYVETSMKAQKTFMSSSFWLINIKGDGKGCDRRTTELDIQETIGIATSNRSWVKNVPRQIASTTHSRSRTCKSTPVGSRGKKATIKGGKASNGFHTYGAWWKGPKEIRFYLDNKYIYTINPVAKFNLPMYLRMSSTSYSWNQPSANRDGMKGSFSARTTFYEWVRTWRLQ